MKAELTQTVHGFDKDGQRITTPAGTIIEVLYKEPVRGSYRTPVIAVIRGIGLVRLGSNTIKLIESRNDEVQNE